MAFSAKTLFNGDNVGLQTYSVVRVFDYITKVLIDFLNRRAFENFDYNTKNDLKKQIIKFLDSVTGPGKLIEKFSVMRFEQDKDHKDKVYLDIHMVPYFPAKNFMIALTGQKGDDLDAAAWAAEYAQQ
jgi:phage tail sheath protein FI